MEGERKKSAGGREGGWRMWKGRREDDECGREEGKEGESVGEEGKEKKNVGEKEERRERA